MSTGPIASAVNSRTSSKIGTSGQCFRSTAWQYGSISQNATVSNPPVRSSPSEKPPMPENKSNTRNFCGSSVISHPGQNSVQKRPYLDAHYSVRSIRAETPVQRPDQNTKAEMCLIGHRWPPADILCA